MPVHPGSPSVRLVTISDWKDKSRLLWLDGVLLVPRVAELAVGLSGGAADAV